MTPVTHRRWKGRGSALTEFVILVPVLVFMIYGSVYLADLGLLKLKAQEIARFGAFAFAVQPLSNYETLKHGRTFNDARGAVASQMHDVYWDLDGARTRIPEVRKTMFAKYQSPAAGEYNQEHVELIPSWGDVEWGDGLGTVAKIILQVLNIGTGTQSFFAGPFGNMRLNTRGQVRAQTDLRIQSPVRPGDRELSESFFEYTRSAYNRQRPLEVSGFRPRGRGRPLREADGSQIHLTLVADSWKLSQGFTATPNTSSHAYRHYAHMVEEIDKRAITALPGGQILGLIVNLMGIVDKIPGNLSVFLGIPANNPGAHTFSRPYTADRDNHKHYDGGKPLPGQVDIFEETKGDEQESGSVEYFETGALYVDHQNPGDSGYVKALNERGNSFMGCRNPQKRGCWEAGQ